MQSYILIMDFLILPINWGGDKEQENDIAARNWDVKNWQDKVIKALEETVSFAKDVNGFSITLTSILA